MAQPPVMLWERQEHTRHGPLPMSHVFSIPRAGLIAFALAAGIAAVAAAPAYVDDILFERDTPYVPTPPDVVERMLDMAAVRKGEYLIDLGSGDGRIAIAAAKRG